jgi:membrane-bound lytic murein transglycosylase A
VGGLGVKLTEGRSIAVDASLYPLGWLAYVETNSPVVDPSGSTSGYRPLRRLVLTQDTGAAITGPGRVDVFFGTGERRGLEAGSMSERGELYLLTPVECR